MKHEQKSLPDGTLVAWYGDDFTGSAAVMEVLTFSGIPAVLFLAPPTVEQFASFAECRAFGIAGMSRSRTPDWMVKNLPAAFESLNSSGAELVHYKICSTFDSSPTTGSIGKAIDIAAPVFKPKWIPLLVGAPAVKRYQAFGNLFASVDDAGYRLDRHPTMSRHPVTPMHEADIRVHLSKQTNRAVGLIDLVDLKQSNAKASLIREMDHGCEIVALDVIDDETLLACGDLIWNARADAKLVVGSQGVEYALVDYWRKAGLINTAEEPIASPGQKRIAVVSGSCSPETARQIDHAVGQGFVPIRIDSTCATDERHWENEVSKAVNAALSVLSEGRDPILHTALGPDDPAITAFNDAVVGLDEAAIVHRLGTGLGQILNKIVRTANLERCVAAGGDTSGHCATSLGIKALTALAFNAPGASLAKAYTDEPALASLEIALKGGQMGSPNYFSEIRNGGVS